MMVIERIQGVRGTNDILPDQSDVWRNIESKLAHCLSRYDYSEIRLPIFENTRLFKRTIGEITDIVEKEMYTFDDRNGDSLTLRPEGTAGCVRACLEHGLIYNQQQKLWYCGPMFRHEKPQKGRYRQFNQLGVEVFGIAGVGIELELIAMCQRFWEELGFAHAVYLEMNTLGNLNDRQLYRDLLVKYFKQYEALLDEDCKRRLEQNPLRILDSKNPHLQEVIANAPKLIDVICKESRQYFDRVCAGLNQLSIPYIINPMLVRGLDYYGHTVFEWVTENLGSQATLCAGGRFDQLVEHLGGRATPAIGFALGMERLILLAEVLKKTPVIKSSPDLYIIAVGDFVIEQALLIAEKLRNDDKNLRINVNSDSSGFKSQFKKADKSGAQLALILGSDEIENQTIGIKPLRKAGDQITIPQAQLTDFIKQYCL